MPSQISIDLDAKASKVVDDLMARSGGISPVELIRRSLALYNAVLTALANEDAVIVRHKDGTEELFNTL